MTVWGAQEGVLHAVQVSRSHDVELNLWAASLFLIVQGFLTLALLRRGNKGF